MEQSKFHENQLIRPDKNPRWTGFLFEIAEVLASAVLCIAVLFTFALRFAAVFGLSMLPALEEGQQLAVTTILPTPRRGDIVILSSNNSHNQPLVKRIIAVAGDEIDLADGRVLVNGAVLDEPYLPEGTVTEPKPGLAYPVRIPAGYVFVLGDNRGMSSDSRDLGFVRTDNILGRAILRFRPFSFM